MVYQIEFKDKTVDVVDRCWLVESRPRANEPMIMHWAVQRRTGSKLRWYKEEDILEWKYAEDQSPDAFNAPPPRPRKAG